MSDENSADFNLIISFPDQSPSFVHGFEAGELCARMEHGSEREIETLIHTENKEVVTRIAITYGWTAEFSDVVPPTEGWLNAMLKKTGSVPQKPNPRGLRVVK